jgi:hypothetical protein
MSAGLRRAVVEDLDLEEDLLMLALGHKPERKENPLFCKTPKGNPPREALGGDIIRKGNDISNGITYKILHNNRLAHWRRRDAVLTIDASNVPCDSFFQ